MANQNNPGFIPPHAGYLKLISYQNPAITYDGTIEQLMQATSRNDR